MYFKHHGTKQIHHAVRISGPTFCYSNKRVYYEKAARDILGTNKTKQILALW